MKWNKNKWLTVALLAIPTALAVVDLPPELAHPLADLARVLVGVV